DRAGGRVRARLSADAGCTAGFADQAEGAHRRRQQRGAPRSANSAGHQHPRKRHSHSLMTSVDSGLTAVFTPEAVSIAADGIATVTVDLADLVTLIEQVRGELNYTRFVDLTVVDRLKREGRFELVYLFYSMERHEWLRLKTTTDGEAPSIA